MKKDNVIRVRDKFHAAGCRLVIYCDNSLTFNELDDVVVWDDDNELVYSMSRTKNNPSESPNANKVVYYTAFEYEVIQFIDTASDYKTFKTIIDEIPVNNEERVNRIKKFFNDERKKRIIVRPGTMTEEELARENPEAYDSIKGEGAAQSYLDRIEEYRESLRYSEELNGRN